MSKWILAISVAVCGIAFVGAEAEAAKRMGSGRSVGTQRNVTAPPAKAPAAAPQGSQQAAPAQGTPGQPNPAAAAPASKWGGILGGLALGGMLGYLLGGGGLGALGNILMIALLAFAAVFIVRALLARRSGNVERQEPAALAGMHGQSMNAPVSREQAPLQSHGGQLAASGLANVPAGFDAAGFLRGARMNFMKLQLANDRGELREIQEFTTPEMFEALKADVAARSGKQETDIMSVDADLLELTTEGDQHWASVRFSGMERDRPGAEPVAFEEVWNLVKPTNGSSGWLLAGIQQMH